MKLAVRVQHVPNVGREERVQAIVDELANFDPQIVTDPCPLDKPSPWRVYRACLESAPADATHLLIVQDDMILASGLAEIVVQLVEACECRLIALCVCHEPSESARRLVAAEARGEAWAELDTSRWLPALANIWPVEIISRGLEWVDEQGWPDAFNADDEIIGRMLRANGWAAYATVPSLAHHDDMVESACVQQKAAFGSNLNRVTAVWRPDVDISRIRW